MTAGDLQSIAAAPHFELTTAHRQIAEDARATPVQHWQRPLDVDRAARIAHIFASANEIMPNAVLLAAPDHSQISLEHSGQGNLWVLKVDVSETKSLVVLDGQHRIAGLSAAQPTAEIPFVLLASHGQSGQYQDTTFAKIFAQVTTTAEGLHPLHNEWLTFAFDLDKYYVNDPQNGAANKKHKLAMKTGMEMCTSRWLDQSQSKSNPFFNRVAFNPESTKRTTPSPAVGPVSGGFQYDATTWQGMIHASYFGSTTIPAGELSPRDLAIQLGFAYEALVGCHQVSTKSTSVFLNQAGTSGGHGHKALQDGFVHGVLRYIAEHGAPADWLVALQSRGFDTTDWSSNNWQTGVTRTGATQTLNKKMARQIFGQLFGKDVASLFLPNVIPPSHLDLNAYFLGRIGTGIEVQGRRMNPTNQSKIRQANTDPRAYLMSTQMQTRLDIQSCPIVTLGPTTPNVQEVIVRDIARPYDLDWSYSNIKSGIILTQQLKHKNPLLIDFVVTGYGGIGIKYELVLGYQ
jgi:DGQHR domain-containing protein